MRRCCEDFLDQCGKFQEDHKAERLDAQLLHLQQQAADVQARLTAAELATEHVQAEAQVTKGKADASQARCQQAAAAQQGGMRMYFGETWLLPSHSGTAHLFILAHTSLCRA